LTKNNSFHPAVAPKIFGPLILSRGEPPFPLFLPLVSAGGPSFPQHSQRASGTTGLSPFPPPKPGDVSHRFFLFSRTFLLWCFFFSIFDRREWRSVFLGYASDQLSSSWTLLATWRTCSFFFFTSISAIKIVSLLSFASLRGEFHLSRPLTTPALFPREISPVSSWTCLRRGLPRLSESSPPADNEAFFVSWKLIDIRDDDPEYLLPLVLSFPFVTAPGQFLMLRRVFHHSFLRAEFFFSKRLLPALKRMVSRGGFWLSQQGHFFFGFKAFSGPAVEPKFSDPAQGWSLYRPYRSLVSCPPADRRHESGKKAWSFVFLSFCVFRRFHISLLTDALAFLFQDEG